jgi:hypothetical protein
VVPEQIASNYSFKGICPGRAGVIILSSTCYSRETVKADAEYPAEEQDTECSG